MPKGRLEYLKRLLPYLKNSSEDCLYLNLFAPIQGKRKEFSPRGDECGMMEIARNKLGLGGK
jgi:hypothetical protein